MRRYWIDPSNLNQSEVLFSGDVFHHIFDVCRQEKGSHFEVLTGDQKAYLVEIISMSKKSAVGKIIETREIPPLKRPYIHLALSVSRYQVMDAVVEKAVEMGVHAIHPFFSDFSFVRSFLPPGKLERWEKIVVSATQQSGRGELMKIHQPVALKDLLGGINLDSPNLGLFAYEGESSLDVKSFLTQPRQTPPSDIWLFVGSEGGFSQTEVQTFIKKGLEPVTLGDQVLRVETACITLLAVLKYEFELMR